MANNSAKKKAKRSLSTFAILLCVLLVVSIFTSVSYTHLTLPTN